MEAETVQEIRDIRGPVEIPNPYKKPVTTAGIVIFIVALSVIIFLYRRLRGSFRKDPPPLPDPHTRAIDAIVSSRKLLSETTAEDYTLTLSEALRDYISEILDMKAGEQTSDEFLKKISSTKKGLIPEKQAAKLEDFLAQCDLVKFARIPLTERELETLYTSARSFVDTVKSTTPPTTEPAT